ncbi:uncharacterized protein LOC111599808 isoform X1 [Drosophila hydei]|uniref:Uncharacterized protein LOC111599808 isoform X1 n=1 Tax=Drosophila hydei TaxID=7224 RepID=A0A6J1LTR3_DROHY|nr:uncharacterized protein LOC111599808 isoform X1 [Drosophila hydei]XP_023171371.1 uncharacterized protein LOC111599808 isoform X1 [Drosophila hydei]XP_023171379.1 uncharacterized protein LOC111599808 isoform X1 [Drosophila hydei]XP_023171388.1 uncharacterized protein LOC111599808 isoform X1 [Drosophila hydei]
MNRTTQTKVCQALSVLLLLTLSLCVDHTASRPSTENEGGASTLPPGADNIEIHHVSVVNGVNHEDHPVIMYKEDFVNEDYDPTKNETKPSYPRLYKHTQRTRHHHGQAAAQPALVEEKILFDVLPETPLILSDADNTKLEPKKEATLHKYPKKYHSRHRRHAYNQLYRNDLYAAQQPLYYRPVPAPHYLPIQPLQQYQRYPTIGKPPKYQGKLVFWQTVAPPKNPDSLDNRGSFDDQNSLFHNSNPDDADFSVFDQPRPEEPVAVPPSIDNSYWGNSWRAEEEPELPPVWGSSQGRRPNNGPARIPTTQAPAWSQTTSRPVVQRTTPRRQSGVTSAPTKQTTPKLSKCVWAIVNCCSQGSTKIRYSCFEEFGCHGAFWGVNPCAEEIRTSAIARLA